MDGFRIAITGDRQTGVRFEEFPDGLYRDLLQEITALTRQLFAMVQSRTPSRSGRLRGAERMQVFADTRRITGRVTVAGDKKDAAKAGALEYGAHRTTSVAAHQMRLDHVFGTMLAAPMTALVGAYNRTPNVREVAFERGPLESMRPEILERLGGVVERAVGEANA
jgi:hypothetical protein